MNEDVRRAKSALSEQRHKILDVSGWLVLSQADVAKHNSELARLHEDLEDFENDLGNAIAAERE